MNIIEVAYKWKEPLQKRQTTEYIIVHHAAASTCSVDDIHRWHQEKGWNGIGYHLFIRKDGTVYRGRPIDTIGAQCQGYNHNSVGVCLEGNYDVEQIPTTQADVLVEVLCYLHKMHPAAKVIKHRDVYQTSCPGANFREELLKMEQPHWAEEYFKYLNDNGVEIKEERFDDKITRGEVFALLARLLKTLKG